MELEEAIERLKRGIHLTKQDKMIDLMADWIGQADNDDGMCMYINECNEKCGECVKQYFEKKAEESE